MCAISCAGVRVLAISRAVSKDMRAERPWETSMVVSMGLWLPLCRLVQFAARQPLSLPFLMRGVRCKCEAESAREPPPLPTCAPSGRHRRGAGVGWPHDTGRFRQNPHPRVGAVRPRGSHTRCIGLRTRGARHSSQTLRRQALVALPHRCRLRRLGEPCQPLTQPPRAVAAQTAP